MDGRVEEDEFGGGFHFRERKCDERESEFKVTDRECEWLYCICMTDELFTTSFWLILEHSLVTVLFLKFETCTYCNRFEIHYFFIFYIRK